MFQRDGLRMGDLTAPQRAAVMTLLSIALSRDGYRKVTDIIRGDEVLRKTAGSGPPRGGANAAGAAANPGGQGGRRGHGPGRGVAFGEDEYYLAFVGTRSATAPWMLQLGGHHLAINPSSRAGSAVIVSARDSSASGRLGATAAAWPRRSTR